MAENITKDNELVQPIKILDKEGNLKYLLDFNRASVKYAEMRGFKLDNMEGLSMSAMEDLFHYSFRAHQPKMTKAETDKILYDELHGFKEGMIERLVELYLQPFNTLMQAGDTAKNSTMTVEF